MEIRFKLKNATHFYKAYAQIQGIRNKISAHLVVILNNNFSHEIPAQIQSIHRFETGNKQSNVSHSNSANSAHL